jgi:hypothetical protein
MGKIIPLPDIEYIHWCNTNKELLEEIFRTGKCQEVWLNAGNNKNYLERYLNERGYTIK